MLSASPLNELARHLTSILDSLNLFSESIGHPEIVEKAVKESGKLFQGYSKALPSKQDSYAAALAFSRGDDLDDRQFHLVASAFCESLREQGGKRLIGHPRYEGLIKHYETEAKAGDLWRLTWFGLLGSYLSFDIANASEADRTGWERLRTCLKRTWPSIDSQTGAAAVPDWMRVLRDDPGLLGPDPTAKYALDFLRGNDAGVNRLARDLGIPEFSWFWQALVLGATRKSTGLGDSAFKAAIPDLLRLIKTRPVFRDDALELILTRYHVCTQPTLHAELRDYVVAQDVWRNPKLRQAGMATAWNRVSDDVWKMVLQWVNEANLKDFFAILAAQGNSDHGRLEFWSQYLNQISWTRLIFSAKTRQLASRSAAIRNLIAREAGAYATLSTNADVDAFMMQLGNYIVVEFSRFPNAAYVYKANQLPFEPYAREYAGTTVDLKHGFHGECEARLTHMPGWQVGAGADLRRLRIYPDADSTHTRTPTGSAVATDRHRPITSAGANARASSSNSVGTTRAPPGAAFTMSTLKSLVSDYSGARIDDRRSTAGGRLWVESSGQSARLGEALRGYGFRWSESRSAWYYPEHR